MLTITEAAWERLSELQSTRPDVTTMRLAHDDGRVKCHRGIEKKNDSVIQHDGSPTLLMTSNVAENLSARTLDAPVTKRGRRLRLKRISRRSI